MSFLDKLPLATLIAVAGIICVVYAYVTNDVSLNNALKDLGALTAGAGILGVARNQAGKGVSK